MKKNKSQVKYLIILGSVSIFFASFLALAANAANGVDTSVTPMPRSDRKVRTPFRTIEGTVNTINANYLIIKTSAQKLITVRLTKNTQLYDGNAKTDLSNIKIGSSVKVRAKLLNKTTLEATAVKIIKRVTPAPTISNE